MRFVILAIGFLWKLVAGLSRFVTSIPATYICCMITGAATGALVEPYLLHKPFLYVGTVLLSVFLFWAVPMIIVKIDEKFKEPEPDEAQQILADMEAVANKNLDTHEVTAAYRTRAGNSR